MSELGRWTCKFLYNGIEARPMEAPASGAVRVRERYAPLRAVDRLLDEEIALHTELEGIDKDPTDYLVTAEGEYAAIASFQGKRRSDGHRFLGIVSTVYADDWYRRVDAHAHEEKHFDAYRAAVRELVFLATLGVGVARRRRFRYQPPASWSGLSRSLLTEWYPPEYPLVDAVITIPSTWTSRDSTPPLLDRLVFDGEMKSFYRDVQAGPNLTTSDYGLSGRIIQVIGRFPGKPTRVIDQVVFGDSRFTYYLRFNCRQDLYADLKQVFANVVKSCQAVPMPTQESQVAALVHWNQY